MPAFRTGHPRCRVRLTADMALSAGTHPVVWSTADYDDESLWNGTSSFTLSRAGLWQLNLALSFKTVTGSTQAIGQWTVNGVAQPSAVSPPTTARAAFYPTSTLELGAGDVLQVTAQRSPTNSSGLFANECWAEIVRIGPVRWV